MSWFDILKRNPMEEALRMRERMGTAKPQSQPTQQVSDEVCAICGKKNFMRGSVNSKGQKICELCKKRGFDTAADRMAAIG